MSFRITGLPAGTFAEWFALSDDALAQRQAVRVVADRPHAFPCRISLTDAEPGQQVILLNYEHQPAPSPYRASHAIYVREGEVQFDRIDDVPDQLRRRLLSVRGFDDNGTMRDADVAAGTALESLVERLFANDAVRYLHVHTAKYGCYIARIDRA